MVKMDTAFDQQLVKWRRTFHMFPEVSRKEENTAKVIVEELKRMGIKAQTFNNHFGVCAEIRGAADGPVIAVRADMDALPIKEINEVPYKSVNDGVMHACGHDGHIAIALGVAKMFADARDSFNGTVKVIFQPAEEASPEGGALLMMKEGILDDVDMIFGLHLWPELPCGKVGVRKGALMAASDRVTIKILGRGAHAGQPQNGVDAITICADVIQGIGHIMSRQLDPLETATINIGMIQGGERYNVIAREVVMNGTVRTLSPKVRQEIPQKIERMLKGNTESQGGSYELSYQSGYPVLVNADEPVEIVTRAVQEVLGSEGLCKTILPVLGAEDFANYLEKVKGAFFFLGCGKEGESRVLHGPDFDFDEHILVHGARIMYQTVLKAMEACGKEQKSVAI